MTRRDELVREYHVRLGEVTLFGVEEGSGPAIVMLHGPMADHRAALPLVLPLAARFRIVTPDLRASGRSWSAGPLTFDVLAEDLAALLDELRIDRAIVGGVSGGSGAALRFALRHRHRTAGLVLVKPVYAGEDRGYTQEQQRMFAMMDAVASRAIDEGVQVLRPLYSNLPAGTRERALAIAEAFDPASVVATSRFVACGAQPFATADDLASLTAPTLLIAGDDPMHPAAVSDVYSARIPYCETMPASTADVARAIGAFADRCAF